MNYLRISSAILLFAVLFAACKKNSTDQQCQKLRDGITANNKDLVLSEITQFIDRLPSNTYSQENLNALAASLSGQCSLSAQVLCFDCIKTLPAQTEIRLSLISSASQTDKLIDISHSPGDNKMKALNMHD